LKLLAGDDITPNEQTTVYMAAHGCHFVVCSLCVLIVIIEIVSFTARDHAAQAVLYKPGPLVMSRVFLQRTGGHGGPPLQLYPITQLRRRHPMSNNWY